MSGSDEMYRRVVEAVPEGIWVVSAEGRTVCSNRRMAQILGVDFERCRISPASSVLSGRAGGCAKTFCPHLRRRFAAFRVSFGPRRWNAGVGQHLIDVRTFTGASATC
ncbi:MAG: PAS domain-containing protein [Bryobacterales bacterium]|nr:PAS domain-containing protein [Bryobacterales bacterium]MBV9400256.1 PAS domain-containing protein [Bryobacterales bacterium]